jgi:hypothetical protein
MKVVSLISLGMLVAGCIFSQVVTGFHQTSSKNVKALDGTYELVSQDVNITKPHPESYSLKEPRWKGMWQIQNGYFSSVLMKEVRDNFYECEDRDLGYESFAGTYELRGKDEILFKQAYSLNPLHKNRFVRMKYSISNDVLKLTQVLHPGIEDLSEGTVTIILKRVSKVAKG